MIFLSKQIKQNRSKQMALRQEEQLIDYEHLELEDPGAQGLLTSEALKPSSHHGISSNGLGGDVDQEQR